MSTLRIAMIMAGGIGERFWPLSRRQRPKQLVTLTAGGASLLEQSVTRIAPLVPPQDVLVVTGRDLLDPIRRAGLPIPTENVVAEPCKRNTAGCVVYAAAVALARSGRPPSEVTMGVITADHRIEDAEQYRATVKAAFAAAEQNEALVTIGIRPTRPETGYGYIELTEDLPAGTPTGSLPALPVRRFREKPDLNAARRFLQADNFLWNSGMFFWRLSTLIAELRAAQPELASAVTELAAALAADDHDEAARVFTKLPDISIDFALMEHARHVLVVPGMFTWDDIGAWDALTRTLPRDTGGNVAVGDPVLIDSHGCVVYNEPGAEKMAVAVVGATDLVVVATADGILVVPKDRAQDVKLAVAELKRRGAAQL